MIDKGERNMDMKSETWRWIQELFDKHEAEQVAYLDFSGICHDCRGPAAVTVHRFNDGKIEVNGGAIHKIRQSDFPYFKCEHCLEADPVFRNFQPCEVFTRVVGYMRPVKQWNKGKKAEYAIRKNFNTDCA